MERKPFITIDNITVRLGSQRFLENSHWRIHTDENWAIMGPNGAGKTALAGALCGNVPVVAGRITHHFLPDKADHSTVSRMIGYLSFELYRKIHQREIRREEYRSFSGNLHGKTTVNDLLLSGPTVIRKGPLDDAIRMTGIKPLLTRDIRQLSAGEFRKAMITRTLITHPRLLILDEPFDGLDPATKKSISLLIDRLIGKGQQVILITQRIEEIVESISHVLFLKKGHIHRLGEKADILKPETIHAVFNEKQPLPQGDASLKAITLSAPHHLRRNREDVATLIKMEDVTIRYGNAIILNRIWWEVKHGQNWILLGPNGAGKSTLLKLISGENLQAYANSIYLFGIKKGSGESVWDIKKHIGMVSPDLQTRYPGTWDVFDVICSGFFDTIGLFRHCSSDEIQITKKWLDLLGLKDQARQPFGQLSHGQRQLALLGRAMVKSPLLLMLDDPCDGLDMANRRKLLRTLNDIGRSPHTNMIYTTHYVEDMIPSTTHMMQLEKGHITAVTENHPTGHSTIEQ